MTNTFVGVAGLPHAGSTLLCQILGMHPEIHCEDESSSLANLLLGGRRMASDEPFMLLPDNDFDAAYGHLQSAMEDFMCGWHHGAGDKKAVVDKNHMWLHCLELLLFLVPEAKLIVCLRELGQIYGSIDARDQKTVPLNSVDHLPDDDRLGRADALFAKDKTIGALLVAAHVVRDLPKDVQDRIYFLRFEDLMEKPAACLSHLFAWLDVSPFEIDVESLPARPQESDSHMHRPSTRLAKPAQHKVPPRIQAQIESAYAWYYAQHYSQLT